MLEAFILQINWTHIIIAIVIFIVAFVSGWIPIVGTIEIIAVAILAPIFGWPAWIPLVAAILIIIVNILSIIISVISVPFTAFLSLSVIWATIGGGLIAIIAATIVFWVALFTLIFSYLTLGELIAAIFMLSAFSGLAVIGGASGINRKVKMMKDMPKTCFEIKGKEYCIRMDL